MENKLNEVQRTPGEWKVNSKNGDVYTTTKHGDLDTVVCTINQKMWDSSIPSLPNNQVEARANAKFICLAVNNHQQLVNALRGCQSHFDGLPMLTNDEESLLSQIDSLLNNIK